MTPTATPGRIPSLDGLRALSIALVLGNHLLLGVDAPWTVFWSGTLGVRVFFVLSGFLITGLLLAERARTGRVRLGRFYARRAFRLLPVAVAFLAVLAGLRAAGWIDMRAVELWAALLVVKDWVAGEWFAEHFWSLSVEEQFYLAWPSLVAWQARRGALAVALSLVVLAPAYRVATYVFPVPGGLLPNVDALMAGALLAMAWHERPEAVARLAAFRPAWGRAAAFALMIGASAPGQWLVGWGVVAVPLRWTIQAACAAYLIASYVSVRRGWSYHVLNWRPVAWVGVLSYSLYVWQQLFLVPPYVSGRWAEALPEAGAARLALAVAAAVAAHYAVERPMLRLRARAVRPAEAVVVSGRSMSRGD